MHRPAHHPPRVVAAGVVAALTVSLLAVPAAAEEADAAPAASVEQGDALVDAGVDEQVPDGVDPLAPAVDGGAPAPADGGEPVVAAREAAGGDAPVVVGRSNTISLVGRGNGHGIGMSQYGSFGQALAGRSAGQILRHYYRGSGIERRSVGFDPRIGITLDQPRVQFVPRGAAAVVSIGSKDPIVAAPRERWEVVMLGSNRCRILRDGAEVATWYGNRGLCVTFDPRPGGEIEVHKPSAGSMRRYRSYGRDAVVEVFRDRQSNGRYKLDTVVELPLEQYLYGLAEMPYSWDADALRAQAIAGRSYALWRLIDTGPDPDRGCTCHLYDSQQDQVYAGADREHSAQWSRWKRAVDRTARAVVVDDGAIGTRNGVVQAFYSSSSNGRTESKHELWGGEVYPYLVSVDDRWTFARGTGNSFDSWTVDVPRAALEARAGLDRVDSIQVASRSSSGATRAVAIRGVDRGVRRTVTRSGSWVRSQFGLRSTTFTPVGSGGFVDTIGNRHASDIAWVARRDITRGCTSDGMRYCPDAPVTRGQMAAFIVRAYGLPSGRARFTDTRGHRFETDIAALAAAGITRGCSADGRSFCPDDPVRRDQMASFLARAERLPIPRTTRFADARRNRHAGAIEAIRRAGITAGCTSDGSRYCPRDPVRRDQMASFLRRALT